MKNKHLSMNNRIDIEKYLNFGFNFTEIARLLDKSVSTISYEVKNRKVRIKKKNPYANSKDYICPKLVKAPFVCNACETKYSCRKTRYEYFSKDADAFYRNTLVNSRIGIDMNAQEFNNLNNIIKEETNKGHSFYMIVNNHKDSINCTPRTLYNYYHKEYLDINGLSLPRIVRYKERKKEQEVRIRNTKLRENRTYQDFLKYKEEFFIKNGFDAHIVQMDTVEGPKEENQSCLLTLLFVYSNFLMAFKMEDKTIQSVSNVFDYLKDTIGTDLFCELFQIILTDNGSEFFDPNYIEYNGLDDKSKVFYCDPRASQQKGALEVTHQYIRRYIPKGSSFNDYSQEDITLMINHINSVPREKYEGLNSFKVQQVFASDKFFKSLGYKEIYMLDVNLKPSLLKTKKDTTNSK